MLDPPPQIKDPRYPVLILPCICLPVCTIGVGGIQVTLLVHPLVAKIYYVQMKTGYKKDQIENLEQKTCFEVWNLGFNFSSKSNKTKHFRQLK